MINHAMVAKASKIKLVIKLLDMLNFKYLQSDKKSVLNLDS